MPDNLKKNYFMLLKLILVLIQLLFISFTYCDLKNFSTDGSILFLAGLEVSATIMFEDWKNTKKYMAAAAYAAEAVSVVMLIWLINEAFVLMVPILILDLLSWVRRDIIGYIVCLAGVILTGEDIRFMYILSSLFLIIIYFQDNIVIKSYMDQIDLNENSENQLKKNLNTQKENYKQAVENNRLYFENQMLQGKSKLSQALHDKLGHSINGSLYQLEAAKVLMDKEPDKSSQIVTNVINNLRGSMDEIRAILRKEKPSRQKMAMLQLYELCKKCKDEYSIEAEFNIEGNSALVTEQYWGIILDNCYEAVSNSLKYSGCSKIEISIAVLNKLIRCTVHDNGKGCSNIEDGMGLSGMKNRVRTVNGIISISGECGFSINMLLPYESEKE